MKNQRESTKKRDIIFALSGGVLLSAAQPPLFPGFLSFFCLIPLLIALRGKRSFSAFALGYLWGFTSNILSLYWIALPTFAGMVAAVVILSLYNALFAVAYSFVERRSETLALILAPVFWIAMEFMRGYGQLGFPWMDLAYSLGRFPVFIQMADIFGHLGISFWIVVINVLVYSAIFTKRRRWVIILTIIIIISVPLIYGIFRLKQSSPEDTIRIALMQGNIPAEEKWETRRANVRHYADMIDSLELRVDLIVLPETATAVYHRSHPGLISVLQSASDRAGAPILTGSLDFDPERPKTHYYNAAVLIEPMVISESYHKMELVPMSENIPFQDVFHFLREIDLGGSHFARGERFLLFDVGNWKFGAPICFESVFARSSRGFAQEGANFLVNITNDDWFGVTAGPYQHANFVRFRAVEARLAIARCAQTGISLFVDEKGRITKSLPLHVKGALIGEIPVSTNITFFTRTGQWLGSGSLFATPLILMFIWLLLKK